MIVVKEIIKKIWTELTRTRAVEFVSYETPAESDRRLYRELNKRKSDIATKNYKKLMAGKLIPYCRTVTMAESGLLLDDSQLFAMAHSLFVVAKRSGKLNELNEIVQETE